MLTDDSHSPNYFSLEDILVTQERIPCKFLVDGPKLGFLNPNCQEDDIKTGAQVELPLWLVQPLTTGYRKLVEPQPPTVYRESYREILKADPNAVNLRKWNDNYYELGSYLRRFDPRGDVADALARTFRGRFRRIADLADNAASDPSVAQRLDRTERRLFSRGRSTRAKLDEWLTETNVPLEAAEMVVNLKKRKRINETCS